MSDTRNGDGQGKNARAVSHNAIVSQVARSVLKPEGLFQKGSSRVWIDDNAWFLTVVEFQPSGWSKGSYLNVGAHFLWSKKDFLSFDYGGRVHETGFVSFDGNEEKFRAEMTALASVALRKVAEYRQLQDFSVAKEKVGSYKNIATSHRLYDNMMLCGLARDTVSAKRWCEELVPYIACSEFPWEIAYQTEIEKDIRPLMDDADAFAEYIAQKIIARRSFWRSKPSMKKLREESDTTALLNGMLAKTKETQK